MLLVLPKLTLICQTDASMFSLNELERSRLEKGGKSKGSREVLLVCKLKKMGRISNQSSKSSISKDL